jgi:hypothetical protein
MLESREFSGAGRGAALRWAVLAALLGWGCGGGGEARPPVDGSAPQPDARVDAPAAMDAPAGSDADAPQDGGGAGTDATIGPGGEIAAACEADSDCKSGFCADGVCCRSECADPCQSCALSGSAGTCMNAPVGSDPRNDCPDDGIAGCMRSGTCDGTGACAVYSTGAICRAQSCAGSTVTHASLCDGQGECGAGTTQSCGQYLCGSDGKCRATCSTAADCVAGAACVNGSCGPKPPGAACTMGSECASMICAQGVCCATACTGTCKSCAIGGSEGQCINVPSGADPLNQCTDQGGQSCGSDGTCDGAGACRFYAGATVCAAAVCTSAMATPTRTCNGAGVCLMGLPVSCSPYQCGPGNACRTTCTTDADCLAPNVCMGTTCGPPGTGGAGGGGGGAGGGAGGAAGGPAGAGGTAGASGSGGGSAGAGGAAGSAGRGGAGGSGGAGGAAGAAGAGARGGAGGAAGGAAGAAGGAAGAAGGAAGAAGAGGAAGSAGRGGAGGTAGAAGAGGRGGAGGGACAGYVFCDDFEDGNATGWTPSGGTWSVVADGTQVYRGGNGSSMSVAGQASWTDQTVTARVKVLQFGGTSTSYRAGIVARATDSSNVYVFAIDASGALRLLKGTSSPTNDGGTGTCGKVTLGSGAVVNTWYTMQMRVAGTGSNVVITTFFDGTMVHDCHTTMATLPSGPVGTYVYGPNTIAEFDDVRVSVP